MNLLPRSKDEFRESAYWEHFFELRGSKAFEWYGDYENLSPMLHKFIKHKDRILVVGCGNSELGSQMFDVGFRDMISVDISATAIKQMQSKHPDQNFVVGDMTGLSSPFEASRFTCILDKGTLDALCTDDSDSVLATVKQMFGHIDTMLSIGGRYVVVSLLQPHVLNSLLDVFSTEKKWAVRVVRCREVRNESGAPVFAAVATKIKCLPNLPSIIELSLSASGQTSRLSSVEELKASVSGLQQFAAVSASKLKFFDQGAEDVCLDLRASDSDEAKYSLYLVDQNSSGAKKGNRPQQQQLEFAVFIVPQGRETEWLFGRAEGRRQLASSANAKRLVVVHLQRNFSFPSLQVVQDELSAIIMELAPPTLNSDTQVPFLSVGAETGRRVEVYRGKSDYSGEFVIEDVCVEDEKYRRLVFLNNPNVVQSEAKFLPDGNTLDPKFLACAHHQAMLASLKLKGKSTIRCLLIGLGGGPMASYITHIMPYVTLTVVELDPSMVDTAVTYFGFDQTKCEVVVGDGLSYVEKYNGPAFDVVLLDVDSKDTKCGMSCPPQPFVAQPFLDWLRHRSLRQATGLMCVNVACRDARLRQQVCDTLRTGFKHIFSLQIPQEVNEVFYCSLSEEKKLKKQLVDALEESNKTDQKYAHASIGQLKVIS